MGAIAPAAIVDRHVKARPRPPPPRIAAGSHPPQKSDLDPKRFDAQIALLPAKRMLPSIAAFTRVDGLLIRPADSEPAMEAAPPTHNAPAVSSTGQCQIVAANKGAPSIH